MKDNPWQKNFEIQNKEIQDLLYHIASALKDKMPPGWGFSLQIFEFGDGKSFFYISSAERDTMIKALKEFIQREQKQ